MSRARTRILCGVTAFLVSTLSLPLLLAGLLLLSHPLGIFEERNGSEIDRAFEIYLWLAVGASIVGAWSVFRAVFNGLALRYAEPPQVPRWPPRRAL